MRRIAGWEPSLGAVVEEIGFERAADGPLTGMTVGIKVQIDVAGCRNWVGLQGHGMEATPVGRDATVVDRLRKAGATLVCTTAAPSIGAPGGVTPQTGNPRSLDRVSGGSSGGSASAVAAGLVHSALGSDSGGSVRIPAACCGVVGLHTTRGLVPLTGAGGLTYSMDCVGPLAATVDDARRVLAVIAGVDPTDPYSVAVESAPLWKRDPLRIGLPMELVGWNVDIEVAAAFERVVDRLRAAGHEVEEVSLPPLREAMELGPATIGIAESGAIIADVLAPVLDDRPELAELVRRSQEVSGPALARAYHQVNALRAEIRRLFSHHDVLLTPTLPCRVPDGSAPHLETEIEVGGALETRTSALTRLVNPWNLAGCPAGTVPIGRDDGGGPISLQVVGPAFSDWQVLDVMEWVEASLGGPWDTVPPPT